MTRICIGKTSGVPSTFDCSHQWVHHKATAAIAPSATNEPPQIPMTTTNNWRSSDISRNVQRRESDVQAWPAVRGRAMMLTVRQLQWPRPLGTGVSFERSGAAWANRYGDSAARPQSEFINQGSRKFQSRGYSPAKLLRRGALRSTSIARQASP